MYFLNQSPIKWFSDFLMLLLCLLPGNVELLSAKVKVFSDEDGSSKFNNLAIRYSEVECGHDSVFIGAVNRLYQLSLDLELLANVTTGPFLTHNESTNNYNKILVINDKDKSLITCGTVPMCTIYDLHPNEIISESNSRKIIKPVVTNDENASTIAFMATTHIFLPEFHEDALQQRLWIAQSHVGNFSNGTELLEVPAFAGRDINTLERYKEFLFFEDFRNEYIVDYIYGFPYGKNKMYLLTIQPNSTTRPSPYISKLIKTCAQGPILEGYVEMPIKCMVKGKQRYNLLQAAYVGKAGTKLAKSMNIHHDDEVLFAIFSPSQDVYSKKPLQRSALCMYSLKAIDQKVDENIKNCAKGNEKAVLNFLVPEAICFETRESIPCTDYCQQYSNAPIDGRVPLKMHTALTFETHITAITARSSKNRTDVFVGTSTGHLKMIAVENITYAYEHGDVTIDQDSPVNNDLIFSSKEDYLFVMTKHRLTKVDLRTTFLEPNTGT